MRILSVPRPNGSAAERETSRVLRDWLTQQGIPHCVHTFRQYPYFFEAIGIWLIVTRSLLAVAIGWRWGWPALLISILGLIGATLDVAFNLPTVTWPGVRRGENILIQFTPSQPLQEIIICAHYDSKTELLDHYQRLFFIRNLRLGILITALLGILSPIDRMLLLSENPWSNFSFGLGIGLSVPLLFLAWGLGLNLSTGRFIQPSEGAVDNGAACAILLGLAKQLENKVILPLQTSVTMALFTGEEVNMQGSRAYALDRDWPLPVVVINLEIMGQDGEYVLWDQDGNAFGLTPTNQAINKALTSAVESVTGNSPQHVGPINSDGYSFLKRGIPTSVLGSYDSRLKDTKFHTPSDNLERVAIERLPEGVDILSKLIEMYDLGEITIHRDLSHSKLKIYE